MGLVRSILGRIRSPSEDDTIYTCQQCGTALELRYHRCPECGGFRVERTDWQLD